MKVSLKTFMPITAASMFALASCSNVDNRAKEYMSETNRTQTEYNNFSKSSMYTKQSKLDSMAYRDIFNSTQAAKDSAKTADFNKIAARMRPNEEENEDIWDKQFDIEKKLTKEGISIKDLDAIKEKFSVRIEGLAGLNTFQHYADDWAYRKFFKAIGIYNAGISKKCDEVSEKIRP